jgi:hypothetical protein
MRKRTHTGMAAVAAMAMIVATGTALGGGGVEVQVNGSDRPTAGGTGAVMHQRTATSSQSSELDRRTGLDTGGSGDSSAIEIRPLDPTRAERGWFCAVLETTVGQYVSIGLVCD